MLPDNPNALETVLALRQAGRVRRWHTEDMLNPDSIGRHTHSFLMLLLQFWPEAPSSIFKEAVYHDLGESFSGDVPAPAKWHDADLKVHLDNLEEVWRKTYSLPDGSMAGWTQEERRRFKVLDLLEAMLFCYEEILFGNEHATAVYYRLRNAINERLLAQGADGVWNMRLGGLLWCLDLEMVRREEANGNP